MIRYREINIQDANKLGDIDRSEIISSLFEVRKGQLVEKPVCIEDKGWDAKMLREIKERYTHQLLQNGTAYGAFDGQRLAGFGVLAHEFVGKGMNCMLLDLMYVSDTYRKQGIATHIFRFLADTARKKGADYLYISSSETSSAVQFYLRRGAVLADAADERLHQKEPNDIHMLLNLHKKPV